ncbi:hypothetical protein BS17DRAFT_212410 [Gyrodon lividus]|nr:hypothetical protein BS17DRAFT_212410 [Gyrodon lividus]
MIEGRPQESTRTWYYHIVMKNGLRVGYVVQTGACCHKFDSPSRCPLVISSSPFSAALSKRAVSVSSARFGAPCPLRIHLERRISLLVSMSTQRVGKSLLLTGWTSRYAGQWSGILEESAKTGFDLIGFEEDSAYPEVCSALAVRLAVALLPCLTQTQAQNSCQSYGSLLYSESSAVSQEAQMPTVVTLDIKKIILPSERLSISAFADFQLPSLCTSCAPSLSFTRSDVIQQLSPRAPNAWANGSRSPVYAHTDKTHRFLF